MRPHLRVLLRLAVVTASLLSITMCSGRVVAATCDYIYFPYPDQLFNVNENTVQPGFDQQSPYWMVFAVRSFNTTEDYDLDQLNGCGGSAAATSARTPYFTDFVVGDFNTNPTGLTYTEIRCYAGACMGSGTYGYATWRPGGQILVVDASPTTVSFSGGSADHLVRAWDVYLTAGTTYFFQFSSTLGTDSKLLLFRNPTGGTFWGARNSSQFEVTGCTTYTAPTTGYYGLVEVNDSWADGSYTLGVTTSLACGCGGGALSTLTPVTVPAFGGSDFRSISPVLGYWTAVGVRPDPGSDWDLQVGYSGSPETCPVSVLASSTRGANFTDVVVADFNHVTAQDLAVHSLLFNGPGGATVEWDRNSAFGGNALFVNGAQTTEVWGASDVIKCWDVLLSSGVTYTFQFFASSNMRLLLFRNPGNGSFFAGRQGAQFEASGNTLYTAPSSGYYAMVVVKDDNQTGNFALRFGTCWAPDTLQAGIPISPSGNYDWGTFSPTPGSWTAVGVRCPTADWDLVQYGSATGATWPDCYAPTGATSESSSVPDFIVGDFHANPPGDYHVRFKQFTTGFIQSAVAEWTGAATPINVNDPPTTASPADIEVLRMYEAFLVGGRTYQINYVQNPGGTRPLLVFANPIGGEYWAPRSAAVLSTQASTSYTPIRNGVYAFVVANDNAETTGFSLQLTTVVAGVETPAAYPTRLLGATPNPGRSDVVVRYSLASSEPVRLELLDLSGRRVWAADEGTRNAGEWSVALPRRGPDGNRIPAGLYFLNFTVGQRVMDVRKLTLLD